MECSRKDAFKEETKDIAYCVCVSALRTICRKYSATGEFEHELEMDAWKAKYTKCGWPLLIPENVKRQYATGNANRAQKVSLLQTYLLRHQV